MIIQLCKEKIVREYNEKELKEAEEMRNMCQSDAEEGIRYFLRVKR